MRDVFAMLFFGFAVTGLYWCSTPLLVLAIASGIPMLVLGVIELREPPVPDAAAELEDSVMSSSVQRPVIASRREQLALTDAREIPTAVFRGQLETPRRD